MTLRNIKEVLIISRIPIESFFKKTEVDKRSGVKKITNIPRSKVMSHCRLTKLSPNVIVPGKSTTPLYGQRYHF